MMPLSCCPIADPLHYNYLYYTLTWLVTGVGKCPTCWHHPTTKGTSSATKTCSSDVQIPKTGHFTNLCKIPVHHDMIFLPSDQLGAHHHSPVHNDWLPERSLPTGSGWMYIMPFHHSRRRSKSESYDSKNIFDLSQILSLLKNSTASCESFLAIDHNSVNWHDTSQSLKKQIHG